MKTMFVVRAISLFLFSMIGIVQIGYSWPVENGVAICTVAGVQSGPQIILDDRGGEIMTWTDYRNGDSDIYAQAIDSIGNVRWTLNGVSVSTASSSQYNPKLVSDGQGGAIITWEDSRSSEGVTIYAQAINSTGMTKWTSGGVPICTSNSHYPQIIADGQGGAIIVFMKNFDIYAQAIDSTGTINWDLNGVAVCTDSGYQAYPQLVSDGQGGAIIVWADSDIYAQAIDRSGFLKWIPEGVGICTASSVQSRPQIISDGQGGAIITWVDSRNYATTSDNIYAQAVNSLGVVKWMEYGIPICMAPLDQENPQLVSDGQGGAMITWQDSRIDYLSSDIYAQAISSLGLLKWPLDGVAISTAIHEQKYPGIITDGDGGAVIIWQDNRNGIYDVYAQRINNNGVVQSIIDGTYICSTLEYSNSQQIIPDGHGAAFIIWTDPRNGNSDIYVQKIPVLTRPTYVSNSWDVYE